MAKFPKRPRDLNQWAKRMVDIATGETSDREPTPEEQGKSAAAIARGKIGGSKGGRARAIKLTAEQRTEIAKIAAQAMKGDGDVVTGLKNKIEATMANVIPSDILAARHRKMAAPGTAESRR